MCIRDSLDDEGYCLILVLFGKTAACRTHFSNSRRIGQLIPVSTQPGTFQSWPTSLGGATYGATFNGRPPPALSLDSGCRGRPRRALGGRSLQAGPAGLRLLLARTALSQSGGPLTRLRSRRDHGRELSGVEDDRSGGQPPVGAGVPLAPEHGAGAVGVARAGSSKDATSPPCSRWCGNRCPRVIGTSSQYRLVSNLVQQLVEAGWSTAPATPRTGAARLDPRGSPHARASQGDQAASYHAAIARPAGGAR